MDWILEFCNLFSKCPSSDESSYDSHLSYELFNWLRNHNLNCFNLIVSINGIALRDFVNEDYLLSIRRLHLSSIEIGDVNKLKLAKNVEELSILGKACSMLPSIAVNFENLRECHINSAMYEDKVSINKLCRFCPHLTKLTLFQSYGSLITIETVMSIVIHARNLQYLKFVGGIMSSYLIIPHHMFMLHCSARLVSFVGPHNFFGNGIYFIGHKLESLQLKFPSNFPIDIKLSCCCPNLTDLHCSSWIFTKVCLGNMLSGLQLRILHISYIQVWNDDDFIELFHNCPSIENLTLKDIGKQLNYKTIQSIVFNLTNLTSLCLHYLIDDDLLLIANNCSKLTDLDLGGNIELTDTSFMKVIQKIPKLKKFFVYSTLISDISLKAFCHHNYSLSILDLAYCKNITDEGLLEVLEWLPLTHIAVNRCPNISEEVMKLTDKYSIIRLNL